MGFRQAGGGGGGVGGGGEGGGGWGRGLGQGGEGGFFVLDEKCLLPHTATASNLARS